MKNEIRQVLVEGIDARRPETAEAAMGAAQLARARDEGEKEKRTNGGRRPEVIRKATWRILGVVRRRRRVARGDACSALTGGKTGGTGF